MSYCNGSDMLVYVDGKAYGHCSTHTTTMNSETKDRAVKPVATKSKSSGLWKQKGVTGLSISISSEGLVFSGESEQSYAGLIALWKAGKSVQVKCMERGGSTPYLSGAFVIASLERVDPAQDDATYSISLENDGEPDTLDETAFTDDADTTSGSSE